MEVLVVMVVPLLVMAVPEEKMVNLVLAIFQGEPVVIQAVEQVQLLT